MFSKTIIIKDSVVTLSTFDSYVSSLVLLIGCITRGSFLQRMKMKSKLFCSTLFCTTPYILQCFVCVY